MALPVNSTWRCGCGVEQTGEPTTYAAALQALRAHQAGGECTKPLPGNGDRIHSRRLEPVSELVQFVDKEPLQALHGPPRPPLPLKRRAREGLSWLPQ